MELYFTIKLFAQLIFIAVTIVTLVIMYFKNRRRE